MIPNDRFDATEDAWSRRAAKIKSQIDKVETPIYGIQTDDLATLRSAQMAEHEIVEQDAATRLQYISIIYLQSSAKAICVMTEALQKRDYRDDKQQRRPGLRSDKAADLLPRTPNEGQTTIWKPLDNGTLQIDDQQVTCEKWDMGGGWTLSEVTTDVVRVTCGAPADYQVALARITDTDYLVDQWLHALLQRYKQ